MSAAARVSEAQIDVVEQDDPRPVELKQRVRVSLSTRRLELLGSDCVPTKPKPVALIAQPAAGHRLSIARLAQQQHAAFLRNAIALKRLAPMPQKTDRVAPQPIELLRSQQRRGLTLARPENLTGEAVKPSVVPPRHGPKLIA